MKTSVRLLIAQLIFFTIGIGPMQVARCQEYFHISSRIGKIPDPVANPSHEEILNLEAKAIAGDWTAKEQFARAYLYEHLKNQYWNVGCDLLENGHLCRALAAKSQSGLQFLKEIIDLKHTGVIDEYSLAQLQGDYARRRLLDARTEFNPANQACVEAVHYFEHAIAQEVKTSKQSCTAHRLGNMYRYGQCANKSDEKADYYFRLGWGCAQW